MDARFNLGDVSVSRIEGVGKARALTLVRRREVGNQWQERLPVIGEMDEQPGKVSR